MADGQTLAAYPQEPFCGDLENPTGHSQLSFHAWPLWLRPTWLPAGQDRCHLPASSQVVFSGRDVSSQLPCSLIPVSVKLGKSWEKTWKTPVKAQDDRPAMCISWSLVPPTGIKWYFTLLKVQLSLLSLDPTVIGKRGGVLVCVYKNINYKHTLY